MTSHYQFCVTLSTVTLLSGQSDHMAQAVRGTPPDSYERGDQGGFWLAEFVLGDHIWRMSHNLWGHDSRILDAATIILT